VIEYRLWRRNLQVQHLVICPLSLVSLVEVLQQVNIEGPDFEVIVEAARPFLSSSLLGAPASGV